LGRPNERRYVKESRKRVDTSREDAVLYFLILIAGLSLISVSE
jgi:hypothetical protein